MASASTGAERVPEIEPVRVRSLLGSGGYGIRKAQIFGGFNVRSWLSDHLHSCRGFPAVERTKFVVPGASEHTGDPEKGSEAARISRRRRQSESGLKAKVGSGGPIPLKPTIGAVGFTLRFR